MATHLDDTEAHPLLLQASQHAMQRLERRHAKKLRYFGALLCLLLMVISWVAMAEMLQQLQGVHAKKQFNKPTFITYALHSAYFIWLPVGLLLKLGLRHYHAKTGREVDTTSLFGSSGVRAWLWKSGVACAIGYVCAIAWYVSLPRLQVSVNTAIYNSACVFVFFFSLPILRERWSWPKFGAILVCVGGVVMVALNSDGSDSSSSSAATESPLAWLSFGSSEVHEVHAHGVRDTVVRNTPLGFIAVIVSTMLYALYEVLLKRLASHDKGTTVMDQMIFIGGMGMWTVLVYWIFLPIFNVTGLERFEWPTGPALTGLLINMGLDTTFNVLLIIGIYLSSPTFIAVGSLLTIPASILADKLFHGNLLPALALGGVGLIVLGFILLNIAEYYTHHQRKLERLSQRLSQHSSYRSSYASSVFDSDSSDSDDSLSDDGDANLSLQSVL